MIKWTSSIRSPKMVLPPRCTHFNIVCMHKYHLPSICLEFEIVSFVDRLGNYYWIKMGNHASGKVKSKGNDKGTSLLFERIERAKQSVGNADVNRPIQEIKTLDAKRVNDCDCSNNDSSFSSSSSSSSQIVSSTNDSSTVDSKKTVESSKISNRSDTNDNSLLRGSLLSLATDDSSITGRNNSNITDDSDLGDESTMMSSMLLNDIGTCKYFKNVLVMKHL